MKKLRLMLALFIILGSWGCGERPLKPLTYKELPIARYSDQDHSGHPARIDFQVVSSNLYMINEELIDAASISLIVSNRYAKVGDFPVIIWAKKETPFEDVWRLMELVSTNKFLKLAIQDGDKPKRTLRTLFRSDRELGCYEHYINCLHTRFMESSSNLVVITCTKQSLIFNNTSYLIEDLGVELLRIKRPTTDPLQIQILAAGDCPYQSVIDVLDVCRKVRLGFTYLGLQPMESPPLTTDGAK